jgi:hypothetical protein
MPWCTLGLTEFFRARPLTNAQVTQNTLFNPFLLPLHAHIETTGAPKPRQAFRLTSPARVPKVSLQSIPSSLLSSSAKTKVNKSKQLINPFGSLAMATPRPWTRPNLDRSSD